MKLSLLAKALLASSVLFSAGAYAEPITVSGSAAFTSDYLFRGVSNIKQCSGTSGMTLTHESGAYLSAFGAQAFLVQLVVEMDLLLGL